MVLAYAHRRRHRQHRRRGCHRRRRRRQQTTMLLVSHHIVTLPYAKVSTYYANVWHNRCASNINNERRRHANTIIRQLEVSMAMRLSIFNHAIVLSYIVRRHSQRVYTRMYKMTIRQYIILNVVCVYTCLDRIYTHTCLQSTLTIMSAFRHRRIVVR